MQGRKISKKRPSLVQISKTLANHCRLIACKLFALSSLLKVVPLLLLLVDTSTTASVAAFLWCWMHHGMFKLLISSWKFFLMQSFNWCCFCSCEWQKLKKHPLISYLLFYCKKLNVTACTLLAHKPIFSLNNLQMLYYGHFSSRVCGPILAPFSFIFCLSNKQFWVYKKMWKCFSGKIWTHDLLTESLLT